MLFVPNLSKSKENVLKESDKAIVEAMRTEIELVEFQNGTLSEEDKAKLFPNGKKKELYEEHIQGK